LEEVGKNTICNHFFIKKKGMQQKAALILPVLLLWSLLSVRLSAQGLNQEDSIVRSGSYLSGKIVTLKDTINGYIIDRNNDYYFNGTIKYKLQPDDSKTFKIKSKDILFLELEGKAPFERLAYGPKSYLMVKHVEGVVKLYETAIDGFDDYGTYMNGGLNTTSTPNLDRYFLVRGSLIFRVSRRMSITDIRKVFPDDNEFLKRFERGEYQEFLRNIKQLVEDYNRIIANKSTETP
jgi:hypothetical protein